MQQWMKPNLTTNDQIGVPVPLALVRMGSSQYRWGGGGKKFFTDSWYGEESCVWRMGHVAIGSRKKRDFFSKCMVDEYWHLQYGKVVSKEEERSAFTALCRDLQGYKTKKNIKQKKRFRKKGLSGVQLRCFWCKVLEKLSGLSV